MTDIFHHWKENLFVHISKDLIDDADGIMILLTDVTYWVDHTDELVEWCKEYNSEISGLTITFPSEKELSMFCLRWC